MGRTKSDVRFPCPQEGCSRSFTRKDHLLRHQRNHDQAAIQLNCSFSGCGRSFVRQDLLTRHLQRHDKLTQKSSGDAPPPPRAPVASGSGSSGPPLPLDDGRTSHYWSNFPPASTSSDIPVTSTPGARSTPSYLAPELQFALGSRNGGGAAPGGIASSDLSIFDYVGGSKVESYEWLFNLSPVEMPLDLGTPGNGLLGLDWAALAAEGAAARFERPLDPGELLLKATSERLQEIIAPLIRQSNHPLTSHAALKSYLTLYFHHFDSQTPLVHLPTFDPQTTEPYLLLAMLAIGAFYSDPETCEVWQRLMPGLAGLVIVSDGFGPDATIQTVLTLLLVEMHGVMMNTLHEHSMRAIFHPACVNLALRNLIFEPRFTPPIDPTDNDSIWRAAVQDETAKRCAFVLFMMDAEHTTLFCHPPALSAFQVRLALPWDDNEWAASSGSIWQELRSHPSYMPPPSFASTLKASLGPLSGIPHSSSFASCITIYGLMSIAGDLRVKEKVLLAVDAGQPADGSAGTWKRVLAKALESWKARLETACLTRFGTQVLWSGLALQTVAQICLVTDLLDIQVHAGWRKILGKKVGKVAYDHARLNMVEWVKWKHAAEATWHAVAFLRAYLLHQADVGGQSQELSDIPHLGWCLYLATLVCWSYGALHLRDALPLAEHFELPSPPGDVESLIQNNEYFQDALAYVEGMSVRSPEELDKLPVGNKVRTNGILVFLIRDTQNPKWEYGREIVHRARYLLRV